VPDRVTTGEIEMKTSTRDSAIKMLNKVPEVTLYFWIIKIMGTTVGETAADFLSGNLRLGLTATSLIMGGLLAASLWAQLRTKRYIPWIYWLTVVLISVVGTLITDNLVDNFGISLATTTTAFSLALLATFIAWYAREKTLSIHSIFTTRREGFYWAAILFTFALGTAAGDLAAEKMGLGYANSALIFASLIGLVAFAHYVFRANAVLAFWLAYILTRPFGASCGDLLSQPAGNGGLGWGAAGTSAVFLATILSLVLYLSATRKDAPRQNSVDET
jgi:uncharacterized membrane-anchored protein